MSPTIYDPENVHVAAHDWNDEDDYREDQNDYDRY